MRENKEAFALFREMQMLAVNANEFTMTAVLSACGRLGALEHGNGPMLILTKV